MARKAKTQEDQAVVTAPVAVTPGGKTVDILGVEFPVWENSPEDQVFVPEIDVNYVWNEDMYDAVAHVRENLCVLTTGHAGTGKSSLFMQIAARCNQPIARPVMNGQMTTSELVGFWLAKGGEMVWVDGLLVRAMRKGWMVIIDEIDNADGNVLCALNTVTEPLNEALKTRTLTLKEKDGELIVAHPNFRIVATANTAGCMAEFSHLYPDRNKMDFAFLSRFLVIFVDYLKAEQEVEVVKAKTKIPAKTAANMVVVANQIRAAFTNGELPSGPCSTRQLFEWGALIARHVGKAKKTINFGALSPADQDKELKKIVQHAARMALNSRYSQEEQSVIDRLVLMTFG